MKELMAYVPESWVPVLLQMPGKIMSALRHHEKAVDSIGARLLDRQTKAIARGQEGGMDIMSILGKFSSTNSRIPKDLLSLMTSERE